MSGIEDLPPDTVEASGACIARFHGACTGYTGPELDPEVCECECHEWEDS